MDDLRPVVKSCYTVLIVAALLAVNCGSESATSDPPTAASLLPSAEAVVDVMTMVGPPRLTELSNKLQAAVQSKPDWWAEYITTVTPGRPIPYHENLGLTENEYEEFQSLTSQMALSKTGEASLSVVTEDSIQFTFHGDSILANIEGLVIDLGDNAVQTPFGMAKEMNNIVASEGQEMSGPWNGVQWKLRTIDSLGSSFVNLRFALGKLTESGRGILYYKVTAFDSVQGKREILLNLEYDLE
jgi:hypothetical protein